MRAPPPSIEEILEIRHNPGAMLRVPEGWTLIEFINFLNGVEDMWDPLLKQRDFCNAMDIPVESKPTVNTDGAVTLSQNLIEEEYKEVMVEYANLQEALTKPNLNPKVRYALAHVYLESLTAELADLIYVICQAANMHGLPLREFYEAIHKANMAKVDPNTGKVAKVTEGPRQGKVKKPDGWKPADVAKIYLQARNGTLT